MKKNVGSIERAIRLVLAVVLLVLYFGHVVTGPVAFVFLAIAELLIVTGLLSFCPLWLALGISTRKNENDLVKHKSNKYLLSRLLKLSLTASCMHYS